MLKRFGFLMRLFLVVVSMILAYKIYCHLNLRIEIGDMPTVSKFLRGLVWMYVFPVLGCGIAFSFFYIFEFFREK